MNQVNLCYYSASCGITGTGGCSTTQWACSGLTPTLNHRYCYVRIRIGTNAPPSSPEDVLNTLLCSVRAGFNRRGVSSLLPLSGARRCRQQAVELPGRYSAELSGLVQVVVLLGLHQRVFALVGQVLRRSQLTQQHCGRHRLQPAHPAGHQTNDK